MPRADKSLFETSFRQLAAVSPRATALISGSDGEVTTREQLLAMADDFAATLTSHGLQQREVVAIQLPNSVAFVASVLACFRLHLPIIPIDRDATGSEVETILESFSARALISRATSGDRPEFSFHDRRAEAIDDRVALIKLSSGSTGRPKGVATSEANLMADCVNIARTMEIRPDDLNLGAIPFSHSYGFSNLVTPLLAQGTAVVISNDYLPLSILSLCNRYGCTLLPGIPMMFDHLSQLAADDGGFETVRTLISAGAPLTPQTSRRFRERFGIPIHTFYGCSECGGITYDREGAGVEHGSAGTSMDGVRLIAHSSGRLAIESDAVALGYLLAEPADDDRFCAGTFTSDDLVQIGENGEVSLVGRIGDLINTAGKKVNPREIESTIREIAGVRDVKVYGEPAGARGEVVAAVVVADPSVTRDEIRSHCREHLSSHKVPRIVKLVEAIPVDERGKVKKALLAKL